ncbi:hypothetical protein A2U01_0038972, partial [Trifolium medium]|nr:hypothetical protein [Trifolium medium]
MDEGILLYGYVDQLFRLNNNVSIITTTVEDREDVTDHHISRFLSPTSDSENKTKVFGFDIEWKESNSDSSSYKTAGAAVQLCD